MRVKQKEQMLVIVSLYEKLCNQLIAALHTNDTERVLYMLEYTQQTTIEWGEAFEKIEPSQNAFVHILEELCEFCYELSVWVSKEAICSKLELIQEIESRFLVLQNALKQALDEIPVTYEFVFMPYKASMWDCMESVYMAAKADESCHAVVIPIPYYNIEDDGARRVTSYEGTLFPEDIPIADYREYDLEEQQPDAIFIHNPFDAENAITSVYPEFYSCELKKYTNHLVYIPYYVTGGAVPPTHRKLSVHEHMDWMILQSSHDMNYYEGDVFEGKLLPLGSPKFDKMVAYEKNRPEMPREWKNILEGRKVFFYNTSITAFLNDTENALRKMESVFACFENKKDVALIWRPHPLLESTIRGLRMEDAMRYEQIKSNFISSGNGVFDTTADINKTIALSDAYIGEASSSVIHLFGVMGKPIFILENGLYGERNRRELEDFTFTNIVECDGRLWTFLHRFNALCNIDMNTGELHIVTSIPGEAFTRGGLVSALYAYGNQIIMSPNAMQKIVIYDVVSDTFSYEILENAEHVGNMGNFVKWKENYLIAPGRYGAMIEYDAKTKQFLYHTEWFEKIKDIGEIHKERRGWIGGMLILEEMGVLLIALARTNIVVIWDFEKRTYKLVTLGEDDATYGPMLRYKEGILLRAYEGTTMYYWNLKKNSVEKWIPELPDGYETRLTPFNEDYPFSGFFRGPDKILVFPRLGNQILALDENEFKLTTYPIDISAHVKESQMGHFDNRYGNIRGAYIWDIEKSLKYQLTDFWISFTADGTMMHVNMETLETREIQPHLKLEELAKYYSVDKAFNRFSMDIPYAAFESPYVTLDMFIEAFSERCLNNNKEEQIAAYGEVAENMDGTCGQKVYETIRTMCQKE